MVTMEKRQEQELSAAFSRAKGVGLRKAIGNASRLRLLTIKL